jgi:hypothetical protein
MYSTPLHNALRDAFMDVLDEIDEGQWGAGESERIANRLVHLVVLYGFLPETNAF